MTPPRDTTPSGSARVLVPLLGAATLLPFVTTGEGLLLGVAVGLTLGNPCAPGVEPRRHPERPRDLTRGHGGAVW